MIPCDFAHNENNIPNNPPAVIGVGGNALRRDPTFPPTPSAPSLHGQLLPLPLAPFEPASPAGPQASKP